MLTLRDLLLGVLLPALITSLAVVVWRVSFGRNHKTTTTWFACAALLVAFCAAYFSLLGTAALKPREAMHYVPWLALVGAVAAMTASVLSTRRIWLALLPCVLAALITPPVILQSMLRYSWSAGFAALMLGIISLTTALCMMALAWPRQAEYQKLSALLFNLCIFGIATGIVLHGSQKTAQVTAMLGAAWAGLWVTCWLLRRHMPPRQVNVMLLMPLSALLMIAHFYAQLPLYAAALLTLSLLGAAPMPKRLSPRVSVALRVLGVLVPLGITIGLGIADFLAKANDPYAY